MVLDFWDDMVQKPFFVFSDTQQKHERSMRNESLFYLLRVPKPLTRDSNTHLASYFIDLQGRGGVCKGSLRYEKCLNAIMSFATEAADFTGAPFVEDNSVKAEVTKWLGLKCTGKLESV